MKRYKAKMFFPDGMEFAIQRVTNNSSEFNPSVRFQREFWKITVIIKGSGRVLINDRDYAIVPGSIYLVHPNAVTTYSMDTSALELYNILFSLNFIRRELETLKDNYNFFTIFSDSFDACGSVAIYVQKGTREIGRKVLELAAEYGSQQVNGSQYLACGLTMLLILMQRSAGKTYHGKAASDNMAEYINRLLKTNPCSETSTSSLAAFFSITPTRLCAVFKKKYGIPISRMRVKYRLDAARNFLRSSSLSVDEVCRECGFRDLSYFHRAFRKRYGITPLKFRKGD